MLPPHHAVHDDRVALDMQTGGALRVLQEEGGTHMRKLILLLLALAIAMAQAIILIVLTR